MTNQKISISKIKISETKSTRNLKTVIIRPSVVCGPEDSFTNLFQN